MKTLTEKEIANYGALLRLGQFNDVHKLLVEARNQSEEQFQYVTKILTDKFGDYFRPYFGIGWIKVSWQNWAKAPVKKPRKKPDKEFAEVDKSGT